MLKVVVKPEKDAEKPFEKDRDEKPVVSDADDDRDEGALPKLNQECVVYLGSKFGPFRCDRCLYFDGPEGCALVGGEIDPGGCCNLFKSAEKDAQEDPIQDLKDKPAKEY